MKQYLYFGLTSCLVFLFLVGVQPHILFAGNVGAPGQTSEPGLYAGKLSKLRDALTKAIRQLTQKRATTHADTKGSGALQGDPTIDGPLYLLGKMDENVQLDAKGSATDPAGFNKFFVHLHALEGYNDPSFAEVIQSAQDLTGFSYLFPSAPEKPLLIFIPGANGEAATYCAIDLLTEESKNFNIIGYTYDPTLPASEMVDTLVHDFAKEKLNDQEHMLVMMSMGNTITHAAILSTIGNPEYDGLFANSHVVSAGFLYGGASTFESPLIPRFVPSLAALVFPPYASIFDLMNPHSSTGIQTNIAHNIARINEATKGIVYIRAEGDHYIDFSNRDSVYATNRDLIYNNIKNHEKVVSPPALFEKNNAHVNVLTPYPAVKNEIEQYLNTLPPHEPTPRSAVERFLAFLFSIPHARSFSTVAASSAESSASGIFDLMRGLLGSHASAECSSLTEVLEDALMTHGANDTSTADAVQNYISLTQSPCTFSEIEGNAKTALQNDGFIVTTTPHETPVPSCGDANGDGKVTTLDIALMRRHILGLARLDADSIDRADINRDGTVSTLDIALLRRKILGDGTFPFACSAVTFDLDASSFDDLGTPPAPALTDITTDAIFDTVSLDLKVNGSDGPVAVPPGSRIVVSWISDGATRCKANWSKTDIKLSGTIVGRLTHSVVIKAACINASGERADDGVEVNVSN